MTLKQKNKVLIETLVAVYPLIGTGLVQIGSKLMAGKEAIKSALQEVGAMEKSENEK